MFVFMFKPVSSFYSIINKFIMFRKSLCNNIII